MKNHLKAFKRKRVTWKSTIPSRVRTKTEVKPRPQIPHQTSTHGRMMPKPTKMGASRQQRAFSRKRGGRGGDGGRKTTHWHLRQHSHLLQHDALGHGGATEGVGLHRRCRVGLVVVLRNADHRQARESGGGTEHEMGETKVRACVRGSTLSCV